MNCKGCLLAGVAILLVGLLALGVFTITAGHFLATEDALSQTDAIVVLGGDGGSFFRVQQGVDLFNGGCAPVVVFSGGTLKDAGIACSSAQLSLEAAQELGLPTDAAIIASSSQSTYDEAVNIRRLAHQHRWHSLIVVTDLFHTRRAARTFRTLLPDTTIYACPEPSRRVSAAPAPNLDASRWWQTEEGLVAVFNVYTGSRPGEKMHEELGRGFELADLGYDLAGMLAVVGVIWLRKTWRGQGVKAQGCGVEQGTMRGTGKGRG